MIRNLPLEIQNEIFKFLDYRQTYNQVIHDIAKNRGNFFIKLDTKQDKFRDVYVNFDFHFHEEETKYIMFSTSNIGVYYYSLHSEFEDFFGIDKSYIYRDIRCCRVRRYGKITDNFLHDILFSIFHTLRFPKENFYYRSLYNMKYQYCKDLLDFSNVIETKITY